MNLKEELRIVVEYMLAKVETNSDIVENYVSTLEIIVDEYTKHHLKKFTGELSDNETRNFKPYFRSYINNNFDK